LFPGRGASEGELRELEAASQMSGYRLLVLLQPDAGHIRNAQLTILDLIGLLQDRVRPILPFEPMSRFADPHNVGGHLGIQMRRNRNARHRSDSGRSLPASHAANPHEVRHHVIAGLHLQGSVEHAWPVEVLADLYRRLKIGGEPRVALEVVVDDGLLDPRRPRSSMAWHRSSASPR